jgi:ribosomal protein S18 acetylase RimI-like enzyme
MAESFHVRVAQLDDAFALAELNSEFNDVAIPPDQIAKGLWSERPSELVVAAEVGGHVVGFACVQILSSVCYAQPWAELTELYVREAHRRQGIIGTALVQEAERLARQKGAKEMVVRTGNENAAGQALYRTLGYAKRPHLTLEKCLSGPVSKLA